MAYRLIYTNFWDDPVVADEMTPEDRYFFLYILTNPYTRCCGIYEISKRRMSFELGYPAEVIENLLDKFVNKYNLIAYNKDTKELAIKNWGKYNLIKGGKPVLDCLSSELVKVKDRSLIQYVLENIKSREMKELFKSFCDTSTTRARQVDNTYTSTSTNTNTNTSTITIASTVTYIEKETCTATEINTITDIHASAYTKSLNTASPLPYLSNLQENIKEGKFTKVWSSVANEVPDKISAHIFILNLSAVKAAVIRHAHFIANRPAGIALGTNTS